MAAGGSSASAPGPGQRLLLGGRPGHCAVPTIQRDNGRSNRIRPLLHLGLPDLLSPELSPTAVVSGRQRNRHPLRSRFADFRAVLQRLQFLIPGGGMATPSVCHWLDDILLGETSASSTRPRPRPLPELCPLCLQRLPRLQEELQ